MAIKDYFNYEAQCFTSAGNIAEMFYTEDKYLISMSKKEIFAEVEENYEANDLYNDLYAENPVNFAESQLAIDLFDHLIETIDNYRIEAIEETFREFVRENISKEDRNDCSIAYKEWKASNEIFDDIEYPFDNDEYQAL